MYHVSKYRKLGFNPRSTSHCIAVDFKEQLQDSIDFAVQESGRVGYRDIEYLALFFNTSVDLLKEVYEDGLTKTRKIMLFQFYSLKIDVNSVCAECGNSRCVQNHKTIEIMKSLIEDIYFPLRTFLSDTQILACIWEDFRSKKTLFTSEEYARLERVLK